MYTDDGTGLGGSLMVFLNHFPYPRRLAGADPGQGTSTGEEIGNAHVDVMSTIFGARFHHRRTIERVWANHGDDQPRLLCE